MPWRTQLTIVAVPILLALGAANAAAQGPFVIDGTITDTNNSGVGTGATRVTDPNGNAQELGPKNASTTKIGVIHTAPLPMLNTTNPNANVDLNTIYTQSAVSGGNLWFYFGWVRDSANGSGFISIELQKNAPPTICNYATATPAALIAGCNPWSGRQDGDFIILWDQQGGSTAISYRIYDGLLGQFGPPTDIPASIGLARYGTGDTGRGEAAINITAIVAGQAEECLSYANIIPGTVTGNSDSADYKDTVLSVFPAATNCGTVVVQKVTKKSDGTVFTTVDSAGPFPFTLTAGTTPIFDGTVDTDCTVSGQNDKNTCQASLAQGGSSKTITDLLARTNFTLSEGTIAAKWQKVSIVCGTTDVTSGGTFSVPPGGSVTCTITNQLKQGSLTLVKTVTNDNGGQLVVADFPLFIDATPATSGQKYTLNSGIEVTASETNKPGYTAGSWGGHCTADGKVTIEAGVDKTCTITNDDQAATLRLVKVVDNAAGGTKVAADFTLTATGTLPNNTFSGSAPVDSPSSGFLADTFTLSESSVAGYSVKTNWTCSGPNGATSGSPVTVGVGESWTCTITNKDAKANPTAVTVQRAVLHDRMNLTGIRPDAPGPAATVTFKLFSDSGCNTQVGVTETVNVSNGSATTVNGVLVAGTGSATYYWTAVYSGDGYNEGVTKGCGIETTTVNFQNNNVVVP